MDPPDQPDWELFILSGVNSRYDYLFEGKLRRTRVLIFFFALVHFFTHFLWDSTLLYRAVRPGFDAV